MTTRKPAGVSWQSWIDRQIEEARANGEFDGLPGHGKPIAGVDRPRDELWWVRDKLKREGVEYLPPALAIRKKAAAAHEEALRAPTEAEARRILEAINDEIRDLNRHTIAGPPTTLMAFDVDEVLALRRERATGEAGAPAHEPAPASPPPVSTRRRWFRRR